MYIALRILLYLIFLLALLLISKGFRLNLKMKAFVIIFVVFLSIAQGVIGDRVFYPFVYWGMYVSPNPSPDFVEYTIKDVNGIERKYPFEILSFSSPRALEYKLYDLIKACECENSDPIIDKYISSMKDVYSKEIDKNGFIEMKINYITIDIGTKELQEELLYTWNSNSNNPN